MPPTSCWRFRWTWKCSRAYAFPGDNQEGITADPNGFLYIAQDSGGILKLKWLREP